MSRIRNLLYVVSKEQRVEPIIYGYAVTPFGEAFVGFCEEKIYYLGFTNNDKTAIYKDFIDFWGDGIRDDARAKIYLESIFTTDQSYDLVVIATALQKKVFQALVTLQEGSTVTYSDIAARIGKPKAVRAVASAIGKNRIAYLIPCHRVIAKSGAMGGYRWGIEQKKRLLQHELFKSKELDKYF